MKIGIAGALVASLWTAIPAAQAQTLVKVGITPAGQPASGLNQETKAPEGFAV